MKAFPHAVALDVPRRPTPPPAAGRRIAFAAVCLAGWLLAGCNTWHPAPVDLHEDAWITSQGQAVWHPARRDVELAGELLIATTPDGQGYLQFAKGPVLLAEARRDVDHWQARFPAARRAYSGPGQAPARLAWNQLLQIALGQPPSDGWTWTGSLGNRWRLEHPGSGEWIEGTRLP